jgi:hypothetical protein
MARVEHDTIGKLEQAAQAGVENACLPARVTSNMQVRPPNVADSACGSTTASLLWVPQPNR